MSYYFDNKGNIINNGTASKEYSFYKCLDTNTAVYYYEGIPEDLYDIRDVPPSGLKIKVYCLIKIVEEQNKIYLLDGINPSNCTQDFAMRLSNFVYQETHNWKDLPIMTAYDVNANTNIKNWTDWGNFGANIIG